MAEAELGNIKIKTEKVGIEEGSAQELQEWKLMEHLSEGLLSQVRYAAVACRPTEARSIYNYALICTEEDEVYVIGDNRYGQLGFDPKTSETLSLTRQPDLSQKGIVGFGTGRANTAAWTADGQLFVTGNNEAGQLGQGHTNPVSCAVRVLNALETEKVVQVSCGEEHMLCLTDSGEVYAWGSNVEHQAGSEFGTYITSLSKVEIPWDGANCIDVKCTASSCLVLTQDGKVFAWGDNEFGQVGVGSSERWIRKPTRVIIPGHVTMIATGSRHCLALNADGSVFVWGRGSESEVEGKFSFAIVPAPVQVEISGVVRITAVNAWRTSICKTKAGKIYSWDDGAAPARPRRALFKRVNELCSFYEIGMPGTWKSASQNPQGSAEEEMDLETYMESRRKIIFEIDGQKITASKFFLKRCGIFREMLRYDWKEEIKLSGVIRVNTDRFSASAFKAFVNYLHTDAITADGLTTQLDLLSMARTYKMERLRSKLEQLIRNQMTPQNAEIIHAVAIHSGSLALARDAALMVPQENRSHWYNNCQIM